tara:strand:+ start:4786 stop:5217 length:432 start_codon:yes stop_codon:yes gene_type:complete
MRTDIKSFNIRVYALIIEGDHILISKELIRDEILFKFPGGGLEFGEGLIEGLQREANEELNQSLKEIEHFYTTDFFQRSTFDTKDQLISIYYSAKLSSKLVNKLKEPIKDQPLFIWKKIKDLKENDLGFSIDKKVLKMVKDLN